MRFMLFDNDGRMVDDNIEARTATHKETLDDDWSDTLQMDIAGTVSKGQYIAYRDRLGKWREYRVTAPDDQREGSLPVSDVMAVNSIRELSATRWIIHFHETNVTLRRAIDYVLDGTRWLPGDIATDTEPVAELEFTAVDGWSALKTIASTWGLELSTTIGMASTLDSIDRRRVNLLRQRGTVTGRRFEYGADLTKVRRTYAEQEVYTRIIPIGKLVKDENTGAEKPVTIEEVNDGRNYLEVSDPDVALRRWGVPDEHGTLRHTCMVVEHSDLTDPGAVMNAGIEDLKAYGTPKVEYEATVIAYKDAGIVGADSLGVGDTVQVVDTTFSPSLRLQARISGVEENLLADVSQTTLTLGSIIESMAERQTIITRTAQTVAEGKPVWDAASGAASRAQSTASQTATEVTGLTGRVTVAESTAGTALSKAEAADKAIAMVGGMSDVPFTVAEFSSSLTVTKQIAGLPASFMAGPPPDRGQIDLWSTCQPVVMDHDSDASIPVGSIRVSVKSKPADDLTVRLAALKGTV